MHTQKRRQITRSRLTNALLPLSARADMLPIDERHTPCPSDGRMKRITNASFVRNSCTHTDTQTRYIQCIYTHNDPVRNSCSSCSRCILHTLSVYIMHKWCWCIFLGRAACAWWHACQFGIQCISNYCVNIYWMLGVCGPPDRMCSLPKTPLSLTTIITSNFETFLVHT